MSQKPKHVTDNKRRPSKKYGFIKFLIAISLWGLLFAILFPTKADPLVSILILGIFTVGLIGLAFWLLDGYDIISPSIIPDIGNDLSKPSAPFFPPYQVGDHKIYPHTLAAIHRARRIIDRRFPIPIDLGLLVNRTETDKAIYRVREVPPTAIYIQPYVQLFMPPDTTTVDLAFEIKAGEQTVFSHRQMYDVQTSGFITPPIGLPISQREDFNQVWTLAISANDLLLASHTFTWRTGAATEIVGRLSSDGEISEVLQNARDEEGAKPLSLDDLLAAQDRQAGKIQ